MKVEVLPTKAQGLALPEAESYRYDPTTGVPSFKSDRENLRDLISFEGLDLFLFDSRGLGDDSGVFGEIASYYCFVQGRTDCPVSLVCGTS
jgi:hypothetical protein